MLDFFSHRHLDVSVFKVLSGVWDTQPVSSNVPAHTPLADLDESMRQLRHWTGKLHQHFKGEAQAA